MSNENSESHGGKSVKIIVNGRERTVHDNQITYEQVAELAFPGEPPTEEMVYTVSYTDPHGKDGTLAPGQKVHVKDGMVFNVGRTNRS
jgi:hypothetical protein